MFENDISPHDYFSHCQLHLNGQATTILLSTSEMLHLFDSIMNNIMNKKNKTENMSES